MEGIAIKFLSANESAVRSGNALSDVLNRIDIANREESIPSVAAIDATYIAGDPTRLIRKDPTLLIVVVGTNMQIDVNEYKKRLGIKKRRK